MIRQGPAEYAVQTFATWKSAVRVRSPPLRCRFDNVLAAHRRFLVSRRLLLLGLPNRAHSNPSRVDRHQVKCRQDRFEDPSD